LTLMAAVTVEGTTTCPDPAAVSERLAALLPAAKDSAGDVALLAAEGDGVRIVLRHADGSAGGTRTLDGRHSCDELAEAAAVIIAAWQNDGGVDDRRLAPTAAAPALPRTPPAAPAPPAIA